MNQNCFEIVVFSCEYNYLETDSSITILSDISLDAHCINVIVVSRVTVVLEVLFLSAQSMVLCLMHVT